ncbi:SsgA family sporulation/cell division regulator [Nocardioides sp.]|uniref:SsgA family sporulation/cell division regulator n=1 Tax=Nocardioides sp. TaxID=35761 RepID=UPI002601B784|nr:SsgA family sporulation/cell division regulator [Nocardioides sp.]
MTQQPADHGTALAPITHDIELWCVDPWGRSVRVPTTFGYRASDPYAVSLTFHSGSGDVEWVVSRTLMLQGLAAPAGEGDVKVHPEVDVDNKPVAVFDFCSPDGRLVAQADSHEVQLFLARSFALVPVGTETRHLNLDALITDLLGSFE